MRRCVLKCSSQSYGDSYEIVYRVESSFMCCRKGNRCKCVSVSVCLFSGVRACHQVCSGETRVIRCCMDEKQVPECN